jgi:CBS domain-containing protein
MNIAEVMNWDVIAVTPGVSIQEAARLMVFHGVSGLPVVDDDGMVLGMVSDGDLVVRRRPRRRVPWWHGVLSGENPASGELRLAADATVGEVMTHPALTVGPDLPLAAAARLLDQYGIRRVPVVSGGRLVGLVSRGDLIRALARLPDAPSSPDGRLVATMRTRINRGGWQSLAVVVEASDGVIALWGVVRSAAEREALGDLANTIDGVRHVDNRLAVEPDRPAGKREA